MATKQTIAELLVEIGVDAKDAEKAAKRVTASLKKVGKAGEEADKGVTKSEKALKRFAQAGDAANKVANGIGAALAGASAAIVGIGKSVLETGANFEKLRAQLKTTTGSAEGADKALKFIKDFAKDTPFQVTEITEAFVKLNNFGLKPTERTMTAFGDFASAMGKDLDQFIEAVLDATTGEFERLKEFGIKTKSEGDNVAFTFKGITTTVGKNSAEIQEFLTGLAEQNFGGAMSEQMQTAGGMMSNLSDAWTSFLETVANLGPLEEFKKLIADLQDAAGNKKGGLAKLLADVLTKAISKVRKLLSGNLLPTLEKVFKILGFVVDNFELLVTLFAGAKFASAVSSVVSGMTSMGIASAGALGPIGAIIAALGVLIPLALEAGSALGDVLAKERGVARTTTRGAPKTTGALTTAGGILAAKSVATRSKRLLSAERTVEELKASGASDFNIELAVLKQKAAREQLLSAKRRLKDARAQEAIDVKRQATLGRRGAGEAEATRVRSGVEELRGLLSTSGDSDEDIARDLGIATKALAGGADVAGALGAIGDAGVARATESGFGIVGRRTGADTANKRARAAREKARKKAEKDAKAAAKLTSPTTVSEFFAAAGRGDLGPIAARTPSTRDIEPTVAVDITNNNFNFRDTFQITGVTNPVEAGKEVIRQVKQEFGNRLRSAGQQLPANLVR